MDMVRQFSDCDSGLGRAAGAGHKTQSIPGMPRWVKAFGIVAVVLVLLVVILHLTRHGFGDHMSMPAADVREHGIRQP
jgi:hypothetical protein